MKSSNYKKNSNTYVLTGCMTTTGPQKYRRINVLTRKFLTTLSFGPNKEAVIISTLVVGQGSLWDHNGFFEISANMYGGE